MLKDIRRAVPSAPVTNLRLYAEKLQIIAGTLKKMAEITAAAEAPPPVVKQLKGWMFGALGQKDAAAEILEETGSAFKRLIMLTVVIVLVTYVYMRFM
jgi:hypothetical protein